jgi:hypothetical protein
MKKKVRDLAGWPPACAISAPAVGATVPSIEQLTIMKVKHIIKNRLDLICMFQGKDVNCLFSMPDEKTAEKVGTLLKNNVGINLLSAGEAEIPED